MDDQKFIIFPIKVHTMSILWIFKIFSSVCNYAFFNAFFSCFFLIFVFLFSLCNVAFLSSRSNVALNLLFSILLLKIANSSYSLISIIWNIVRTLPISIKSEYWCCHLCHNANVFQSNTEV